MRLLRAVGVSADHLRGLRKEYGGADDPDFTSVLQSIERQDNKLSDVLWNHAIAPSDVTLTAIMGLKDRVASEGARDEAVSPPQLK